MRIRAAIAPAVLAVLAVGCGTASSATTRHPAPTATVPAGMHRMPDGTLMRDSQMSGMPGTDKPSAAAAMICSPKTHHTLQRNLGAATVPGSSSTWANDIYTCSYHLAAGDLVASVQDATNTAAGQRFFDTIRSRTPGLQRVTGLSSFGLLGYADNHGIVLFIKDGKTLEIDGTGLHGRIGRYHQTPAAVAYGLAADILACWSGH